MELLGGVNILNYVTTKYHFTQENLYKKERRLIHKKIIEDMADNSYNPFLQPEAILIGGGVASGKSTIYPLIEEARYEVLGAPITFANSDFIKNRLPEYNVLKTHVPTLAADIVHDESSDLSNELLNHCIDRKLNFIYEGTMKNKGKYEALLQTLKKEGFLVICILVDVPLDVAKKRAEERFEITGRFVPETIIEESHKKAAYTFKRLKLCFDEYILYDNSGEFPELIASMESGLEDIVDFYRFNNFIAKGEN